MQYYKIHKIRGFSDDIPSNYSEDFSGIKVDIKGLNLYYIFKMIMSVFMFKKAVCTIVSTLCILFLLSACDSSIDDYESYKNLKVGEHFSVNRDGYAVKINDTLLVWHNLADGEKDCVKVIDKNMVDASGMIEGEDVLNGSKELLADKIKNCYSSNDYVIMELLNNDTIITVDCNNNFKYSKFDNLKSTGIDYSKFNHISID